MKSSSKLNVLIVASHADAVQPLAESLSNRGHTTRLALDPEKALGNLGPSIDVLVCEKDLPLLSGLELLSLAHARGLNPCAILLLEGRSFDACRQALQAGFADVIPAPWKAEEVVAALEQLAPQAAAIQDDSSWSRRSTAHPESIRTSILDLLGFALAMGAFPSARIRLGSAVAEALDNVRRHAYPGAKGEFEITAQASGEELRVCIRDFGCGFDPVRARLESAPSMASESSAANIDQQASAAGGLSRIHSLVESMRLTSGEQGSSIELSISTGSSTFQEDSAFDLSEIDYLSPETSRRMLRAIARGENEDFFNLSPAVAVSVGRLLAGQCPSQLAQSALWS